MSNDTETHQTTIYPTERQYQRWKGRAEDREMSVAEWVECMVEAGQKKFDATVAPDESVADLRKQREDLKTQLSDARKRIERLEDELHHGEREVIRDFVRKNPGATYDEIIRHVIDTVPSRVTEKLDALEGEGLRREDDGYYPAGKGEGGR